VIESFRIIPKSYLSSKNSFMMSVTSSYRRRHPLASKRTIELVVKVVWSLKNWCRPFS